MSCFLDAIEGELLNHHLRNAEKAEDNGSDRDNNGEYEEQRGSEEGAGQEDATQDWRSDGEGDGSGDDAVSTGVPAEFRSILTAVYAETTA